MEQILEYEDLVSLSDIIFYRPNEEVDIWSLSLLCANGLQKLSFISRNYFYVSPNSILFDIFGNVRFYDSFEVDPLFTNEKQNNVTARDQIFSLGMTLMYANDHNKDVVDRSPDYLGCQRDLEDLISTMISEIEFDFKNIIQGCRDRVTLKQARTTLSEIYKEVQVITGNKSHTTPDMFADNGDTTIEESMIGPPQNKPTQVPNSSREAPKEFEAPKSCGDTNSSLVSMGDQRSIQTVVDIPTSDLSRPPTDDSEEGLTPTNSCGTFPLSPSPPKATTAVDVVWTSQLIKCLNDENGEIMNCDEKLKTAFYLYYERLNKDDNVFLLDSSNFEDFVSKGKPHPLEKIGKRDNLAKFFTKIKLGNHQLVQLKYYSVLSIQIFSFVVENNYQSLTFPIKDSLTAKIEDKAQFMNFLQNIFRLENIFHGGNAQILHIFRFFMSPEEFFEIIVAHMGLLYRTNQQYYVQILRVWILEFYGMDFKNEVMAGKIGKLFDNDLLDENLLKSLKRSWERAKRQDEYYSSLYMMLLRNKKICSSKNSDFLFDLRDSDILESIHFLLRIVYKTANPIFEDGIFRRINEKNTFKSHFTTDGAVRAQRIESLLSNWLLSELLNEKIKSRQILLVKKYIKILKLSSEVGDFATAHVVLLVLQSVHLINLNIWSKISTRSIKFIERVERTLDEFAATGFNFTCSVDMFKKHVIWNFKDLRNLSNQLTQWNIINRHNREICGDVGLLEEIINRISQITYN